MMIGDTLTGRTISNKKLITFCNSDITERSVIFSNLVFNKSKWMLNSYWNTIFLKGPFQKSDYLSASVIEIEIRCTKSSGLPMRMKNSFCNWGKRLGDWQRPTYCQSSS